MENKSLGNEASLRREDVPKLKIQKLLKLREYVRDFLLITTPFLSAAQIQSEGGGIDPRKFG